MREGKCINYNFCDSALANKVTKIENREDTYYSECGDLLQIIGNKEDLKKKN